MEIRDVLFVHKEQSDYQHARSLLMDEMRQSPLKIDWASSYREALVMMGRKVYDVYFFDYALGRYTGIDLLQQSTENRKRVGNPMPVIILSNSNDSHIGLQALKAGAADYIPRRTLTREVIKEAMQRAFEHQQMQALLAEQRARVESLNRELLQKNKEIQSFYYTLSHELKTPLTSAREFVSIMLDKIAGPITETQQKYLEYVLESCDQLTMCVNDLLDVTRIDTGKMDIQCAPIALRPILDSVVLAKQAACQRKHITLTLTCPEELPKLHADSKRLKQVLLNLLDNAVKFTPNSGQIHLTAQVSEGMMQIAVRDTGRGIPAENLNLIFERLYQVRLDDSSKEAGLGLGLHICQELVRLHGGHITVESTPGQGTCFTIMLPLTTHKH